MSLNRKVLSPDNLKIVSKTLQAVMADLIDLALQGKQSHWTLIGPQFQQFHEQLDIIVADARDGSDEVAERLATLGHAPDGSLATVSQTSRLPAYPQGFVKVSDAVTVVADRLKKTIEGVRTGIEETAEPDPVSQDLLIGIATKLEKHLWMVQAQEG